jgi:hypothetical protein
MTWEVKMEDKDGRSPAEFQKDVIDQVLVELKDLIELYGLCPDHLKETLSGEIVSTANEAIDQIGPYNLNPNDENVKVAEKLLIEVEALFPGRVDKR